MSGGKYSFNSLTPNDGMTLGVFVPFDIKPSNTDYQLKIEAKYENKPGRLAKDLYGSERLAWVFMVYNPNIISDPIYDLKAGMTITVPTKDTIMSYM